MTSDGERTFEWDAENRLIAVVITATGHRSEFGYDGLGRRVVIKELDPDANQVLQVTSDKKYLWDGVEIAEERDATGGTVLKRFFSQGFVDTDGTALFYTRDHLGSIRELTDSSQTIRARYDYDPYGRMTKVQGDKDSPFTYTGHFWHAQSGLNLPLHRAYDPNLGRWISRDPIGENGGINLYGYVYNSPINDFDEYGLDAGGSGSGTASGYGSVDSAGRGAVKDWNPDSKKQNKEHCGMICKDNNTGKYSYTHTVGSLAGCTPGNAPCPSCTTTVGAWHTHGNYSDSAGNPVPKSKDYWDSEHFSPADIGYSAGKNFPLYLGTPGGDVRVVYPHPSGSWH